MEYAKPNTILLVEDDRQARLRIHEYLEGLGFEVIESVDAKAALDLALSVNPDLILMDLSDDDDLDFIYRIRMENELSGIPILASSSDGARGIDLYSNIEKFGDQSIGYITKPISVEELSDQLLLMGIGSR